MSEAANRPGRATKARESVRHKAAWKAKPTTEAEMRFWAQGISYVAGLDEAGRGAWAGPVYAAAVIIPQDQMAWAALDGVRDSKQLSLARREVLATRIAEVALAIAVGYAGADEIDTLGIVPATRLAMRRAVAALALAPEALVIDALALPTITLPQHAFPYADAHSLSVASAGIIAKVNRDHWMINKAESIFPGYGFAQHKGYGTKQHQQALERLGICSLHRRTFRPIALHIEKASQEASL